MSWPPHRFACIAALREHTPLATPVAGHGRQYTTFARLTGKHDQLAVGCEAGPFFPTAFGEDFHLPGLKILYGNVKLATDEMSEYETFAVRTVARRKVGTLAKRHALLHPALHRHTVDLRAAAAIRGEQQILSVRREIRLGVDLAAEGNPLDASPVRTYQIYLRAAIARQHDSQLLAVRTPGRGAVAAAESGHDLALIGVQRLHIHHGMIGLETDIGEMAAVR